MLPQAAPFLLRLRMILLLMLPAPRAADTNRALTAMGPPAPPPPPPAAHLVSPATVLGPREVEEDVQEREVGPIPPGKYPSAPPTLHEDLTNKKDASRHLPNHQSQAEEGEDESKYKLVMELPLPLNSRMRIPCQPTVLIPLLNLLKTFLWAAMVRPLPLLQGPTATP